MPMLEVFKLTRIQEVETTPRLVGAQIAAERAIHTCLKISFCVSAGKSRIVIFGFFGSRVSAEGASISVAVAISEVRLRLSASGAGSGNGVNGWRPSNLNVLCQTSFSWRFAIGVTCFRRAVLLGSDGIVEAQAQAD